MKLFMTFRKNQFIYRRWLRLTSCAVKIELLKKGMLFSTKLVHKMLIFDLSHPRAKKFLDKKSRSEIKTITSIEKLCQQSQNMINKVL